MIPVQRVAVLGAGSWGTTFAKVLADAGREVVLWSRREAVAADINARRVNPGYLSDIVLPESIRATADIEAAVVDVDAVALAVPSQSLRDNLTVFRDVLPDTGPVISLAKGVEIGTGLRMSELIAQIGRVHPDRIVVLSGPNLAREIAAGEPAAAVLACVHRPTAVTVQASTTTPYFRTYTLGDVVGAEIGGTGKNVIALAAGIAEGLGLGGNTNASLITRGLAELTRLGTALGAQPATFAGLSGLGDLVATCSSSLSRNRSLGLRLGASMALDDAIAAGGGQIAEGVASCRSVRELADRHGVEMPITEGVYRVCYQRMPPAGMITLLLDSVVGAEEL